MRTQIITRVGDGNSNAAVMDYYGLNTVAVQVVVVSGTPNWTVQQTLDNVNDASITPTWFNHPDTSTMVAQTVSRLGSYSFCPSAVRVVINSGAGTVRMTLLQHGAPGMK